MEAEYKTIESLVSSKANLVEVELMLTPEESRTFASYCKQNDIKFNDWIRKLAYDDLEKYKAYSDEL